MTLSLYEPPSARGWLHPAPTDLAPAHPRLEASHNCGTAVPWHLPIRSSGGEFDSRSSPPFAGYSLIQVFGATKIYWARKMYSFRELDIGVLTVSVAIAACSVADCGEGVVFSVLTSAGGCISAMCSYRIPHWSLKVRSPKGETGHSNVIRIAAYDRRAGPIWQSRCGGRLCFSVEIEGEGKRAERSASGAAKQKGAVLAAPFVGLHALK